MALGDITTKYETGGIGTSSISNAKGDSGGASYGKFQLSYNKGSLKEYLGMLQQDDPEAYKELSSLWSSASQGKSGAFGKKWIELANQGRLQNTEGRYATSTYIDGGLAGLQDRALVDRIRNNPALMEAFLSTTVQHGAHGGANVWNRATNSSMSDEDIIRGVYAERGRTKSDGSLAYFGKNSRDIQRSVANRFKNEVNDIVGMLGSTSTNPNTPRPSAVPTGQGFTSPMVAQSIPRESIAPVAPRSEGFVGFQNSPNLTNSLIATVYKNNANLAGITPSMGSGGFVGNLATGIRYNPVGMGFGA